MDKLLLRLLVITILVMMCYWVTRSFYISMLIAMNGLFWLAVLALVVWLYRRL